TPQGLVPAPMCGSVVAVRSSGAGYCLLLVLCGKKKLSRQGLVPAPVGGSVSAVKGRGLLCYCGGGAGKSGASGCVSVGCARPSSENPPLDSVGGVPGLSIVDGGRVAANGCDCAASDDDACCGAAPGCAYSGRWVSLAATSTSRNRFDSWIPCDTQSTSAV